jgi:hypothetical protein
MRTLPFLLVFPFVGCTTYLAPEAGGDGVDRVGEGIVGGSDAPVGRYRYQVSLQDRSGFHFCGGSLIADGWVLTAAHCVVGERPSDLRVEADITRLSESGALFDVAELRVHPGYVASTSQNDVALIRLARSTGSIPPIALMDAASEPTLAPTGGALTVTGWGTLSSGGSSPDRLQQVSVPIVSRTSCQASYPAENITAQMMCAGAAGRDSCQGDSGGPAVVGTTGADPALTGVVSWGYGCADPAHPGVYARVSQYSAWISGQVPGVRFVAGGVAPDPEPEPTDDHGDTLAAATVVPVAGTVTLDGVLDSGDRDVFRLDLAAAGAVSVGTASAIDTYGTLLSTSGAALAQDDDSGPGNNFSVATTVSGTTLYLEVRGYDARAAGAYTLTVTGPAAPEPVSDADFVLDLRTTTSAVARASDRIDAGVDDAYTIEILANGPVTLAAASAGATDTFGTLSDAAGAVLATDDDAGPSLNFSLTRAVSPGIYLLEVRGYSATTTGAYDLDLQATR